MNPLRVGIIGAGAWATRYHLPALQRLANRGELRIAGIWSRTRAHAEAAARSGGIPRVYERMDDLLGEVDCVSVVVSKQVVAELLARIARRGVPFITEKPPGASFAQIDRLAREIAVPHVVGFNRRYQPLSRVVMELLPELVPVQYVECTMTRAARNDAHFVTETGIHCLDLLAYWFGPVRKVDTVRWQAGGSPAWVARLFFESGLRGVAKLFPFGGANTERYEIHSEHQFLAVRTRQHHVPDEPNEVVLSGSGGSRDATTARIPVGDSGDPLIDQGFLGEYEDLLRAIRAKSSYSTLSNLRSCLNAIRIAELIETPRR